jgi:predicted ATPase/DNA-binding SARP family transcriptional activator
LLVLDAGRVVSRDRLIEELWHGAPPNAADVTLRTYLSQVRAIVGDRLQRRASGYCLALEPDELDARRFEQMVERARVALARDRPAQAAHELSHALALWRGAEAYADVEFEPFARAEISRLGELRLEAIEEHAGAELRLGRHEHLVPELERLVAEHPLRERLWSQLMLALYRSSRQADALAAYRSARALFRNELGLEPGDELRRLHRAILRHEVAERVGSGVWHNLPAPLSSFVGRERELVDLDRLLDEARLVTVTGLGGVGKTRLALAVATRVAERVERVCLVDLSDVRDPGLVGPSVADALGVADVGTASGLHPVVAYLDRTEVVLVLDNCEHLLASSADLCEHLLTSVSSLRVLATSRERLGVTGEIDYGLAPLPIPSEVDDPAAAPSVRLFLERAIATRSDFGDAPETTATVARICDGLDGLPLAIELAAAHAKALTSGEIEERLDRRFDFLQARRDGQGMRHQGLRAAMEWSFDLLSHEDQGVMVRLAVFAGGFTVGTAASVCADGDERRAADAIERLVERSLVVAAPGTQQTRYRMLETVRRYAEERLAELGNVDEVRSAHAHELLRLAEAAFGPGRDGLAILAVEQGNLRGALDWSFAAGDPIAPRLVCALGRFWHARHQLAEGRGWHLRALELHVAADLLRAELLWSLAGLLQEIGDLTAAEEALRAGLGIVEVEGDPALEARIRARAADVRELRGSSSDAETLDACEAAAEALEAAGDLEGLAEALSVLGKLRFWRRDPADQETLERAITAARASGNRPAELRALEWLAITFADLRVPTEIAIQRHEQALSEAAGEPRAEAGIRASLALVYGFAGRFADAREAIGWSGEVFAADVEMPLEWAGSLEMAGSIELMAGDAAAAERVLRPAYDALRAMGDRMYLPATAYYLASSLCAQARYDEAQRVADAGLAPSELDNPTQTAMWKLITAKVLARRGEVGEAELLALAGASELCAFDARNRGEALLALGDVLAVTGQHERAADAFRQALTLYEERNVPPLAAQARTSLSQVLTAAGA